MEGRWHLGDVAEKLHNTRKEEAGFLLTALQNGEVTAYAILRKNFIEVDVPLSVWRAMDEAQFKVRRRRNGRWFKWRFAIALEFTIEEAKNTIHSALAALISGDQDSLHALRDSKWLKHLSFNEPHNNADKISMQRMLVEHLHSILDEAKGESIVYMSRSEAAKLIGPAPPKRENVGGRPLTESEEFWIEFLRVIGAEKPKLSREHIVQEIFVNMERMEKKGDISSFPSNPWMKKILRTAYQKLDWSND
jgi:hypothetical protein